MRSPTIAASVIAVALTACSPQQPAVDLTSTGRFDPVQDRARVLYCLQVHMAFDRLGREVFGMDETAVAAEEKKAFERSLRLRPFGTAIDLVEAREEGALFSEASRTNHEFNNAYASRSLVPGAKPKLWAELIERSEKCDALVQTWGPAPL